MHWTKMNPQVKPEDLQLPRFAHTLLLRHIVGFLLLNDIKSQ